MIKIRSKGTAEIPNVLLTRGLAATKRLEEAYDNGERSFSFDSGIYGHDDVRESLKEIQGRKCCFCEAKIGHVLYGDVEHFRPEGGWVQESEPLNQPGYYWLAYDWDNLFLACQLCNQRYKQNYFPLANPAARAASHNADVTTEEPQCVHPANDDPEEHITFNENVPKRRNKSERGKITIERLGLDRPELNEVRLHTLNTIRSIYKLAKNCPDLPAGNKQKAREEILARYEEAQRDDTEYASMLRAFFRKNPVDF